MFNKISLLNIYRKTMAEIDLETLFYNISHTTDDNDLAKKKMYLAKKKMYLAKVVQTLDSRKSMRIPPLESNIMGVLKNDFEMTLNDFKMKDVITSSNNDNITDEKQMKKNTALIWLDFIFSEKDGDELLKHFKIVLNHFNYKENGDILFKVPNVNNNHLPDDLLDRLSISLSVFKDTIKDQEFRGKGLKEFIDKMIRYLKGEPEPTMFSTMKNWLRNKGGKKSRKNRNKSNGKNKSKKTKKANRKTKKNKRA